MSPEIIELLSKSLWETTVMVSVSTLISTLVGLPLGILLTITGKGHLLEARSLNRVLGAIINAGRSVPFIILLVAIIPFTRLITGTSIGTMAAIVPLSIAAIPFVARVVETALKEVDNGIIEAALSMGASPWQLIYKVLLPESWPGIIAGLTLAIISLIGYSAMAGAIGGGGLGDLAIRYGYQRFRADIMLATVVILLIQVQLVQSCGDWFAHKLNKK
ncbi:methionine ABC transporter permease [Azotosporobacter soli]|uniref:methionine ABC transporter permease n=1 Tax=Azotosporobacter soli TaxID=3055040 RepID=UPI0031FF2D97